ncbi:MAG: hypothetical protein BJ554DRAFT_501 [Olpidium bornovanus]|uniref:Uncharacterized protein n=1 Tax=Olpidium bornovanus TaxID=278681 RepID=A0A8H7ZTW8_9FUNG|nr:MAG: hypothetical protein BJ554DRAFT_501 [Olpidium bornovanus]
MLSTQRHAGAPITQLWCWLHSTFEDVNVPTENLIGKVNLVDLSGSLQVIVWNDFIVVYHGKLFFLVFFGVISHQIIFTSRSDEKLVRPAATTSAWASSSRPTGSHACATRRR